MKRDKVYLIHIMNEINFLLNYTTDIDFDQLIEDEKLSRATIRSLEIIGEASKNLSEDFKNKYQEIEWKKIIGLRDKLIHHYFGVDWDIVSDIVENKLKPLRSKLNEILIEMEKNKG